MIEFGDSVFYLDLKAFDKAITLNDANSGLTSKDTEIREILNEKGIVISSERYEKVTPRNKEVDAAKYDLLKTFVEYIIDSEEVDDDSLGVETSLASATFGYKLVFNTLYKEGIIKERTDKN